MARRSVRLLALTLLLLHVSTLYGQTGTQAVLVGVVTDERGQPLPAVTVTVHSRTGAMAPLGALTDANGRYRFSALPPRNDFRVLAEIFSYATVEVGPIDLDPGKTTTVNLTLLPSSRASEKVTVVAKGDIVDLASTKTSTVFNSEFIEGLPILGRTYQSILTLAPGVTDVDGDGNPNVNGARATELQTLMDGANTTDPFSGTFGMNLNLEAIAEIEVITTGFPAEYGGAQGGFANIVTKSGGNDLTGSFKFFFRSDLLDNDGANNNDVDERPLFADLDGFRDIRPFLTLGGPFIKDKLWYFVALEYLSMETPVNAGTLAYLQTEQGWNNFAKLTWQPTSTNRLSFQVTQDPRRFTGLNLGTGVDPESDFFLDQGGAVSTVRWTKNISPSVLLESLGSYFDTDIEILPISEPRPCGEDSLGRCNPVAEDLYTFSDRAGLVHGPYFLTHRDTRERMTLKSSLSLYLDGAGGQHNIKTGLEVSRERYENGLTERRVRFDDYALASAAPFSGGGGAPAERLFEGTIQFRDAFPQSQVRHAEKDHLAFYLQDLHKPLPNLAIQTGLRFDREDASTEGWEPFEPEEEAQAFLELLARGRREPVESLVFPDSLVDPSIPYDINGDGRDDQNCRSFLDAYNNQLVTGFVINETGTYSLVGEPGFDVPDGIPESFFHFQDLGGNLVCLGGANAGAPCTSDADCGLGSCGIVDGVAALDPALVGQVLSDSNRNYGDPATGDSVFFFPDGNSFLPDGTAVNPNCDRLNEDIVLLYTVFHRHQLDEYKGPVDFPGDVLGGTLRQAAPFNLTNHNLAPRVGVSWDPWADNKTKFYAFWGRYYGTLHLASIVPEVGPDPRTSAYDPNSILVAGADSQPFLVGRFSVTQVARDLRTPYTEEFTLGVERELSPNWAASVTYIKRSSTDLLQDVDVNHFTRDNNGDGRLDDFFGKVIAPGGVAHAGQPGDGPPNLDPGGGVDLTGTSVEPDGLPDLFAYNPFFSEVLRIGNFNSSEYESVQVVLTRRLARRWQMNASYVWSEIIGDAEDFLSVLGDDVGTVEDERGPLDYDQTHVVKLSGVTFLPKGQTLGGIILWASGLPFSIIRRTTSFDSFGSSSFRTSFPTGQRNDQRNEAVWSIDVNYKKSVSFGSVQAILGAEVQNLLNSDDLRISTFALGDQVGLNESRRFGRRWQLSFSMSF